MFPTRGSRTGTHLNLRGDIPKQVSALVHTGCTATSAPVVLGDHAEVTTGSVVSANHFDALGVHPILGRGFENGGDVGNDSHPLVVIIYQMWRNRFKGDPQIIGKTQRLNNVPHTIIGVAPEGFYGTFVGRAMQFWVPVSKAETFEDGGYKLEDRGARWIASYVRLKPGVTFPAVNLCEAMTKTGRWLRS